MIASRPFRCSAASPRSPWRPRCSRFRSPTSSASPRARRSSSTTTPPGSRSSSRGRLQEGETVLIHGAAGGVGTAAIQVCKGVGARTIGVVSSDEKERVAREAGADEVVRSDGAWKDEAKELSGGGVDVVIDPVGGDRFTDSLRSLAEGGRVVVVGFTAGSIPEVKVNRLLLNNVEVIGAGWGAYVMGRPEVNREIGAAIGKLIDSGVVRPIVGADFPLSVDGAAAALNLLDGRGATGKVVLDVAGEGR